MTPLVFQRAEAIDVTQIPNSVLAGIGIIPPPPGVAPDFANPVNIRPILWVFCGVGFGIIAILIFMLSHPIKWAWSDVAFTLAVLTTVASFVYILIGATGFGRSGIHSWDASVYNSISLRSRTSIALVILLPPISIGFIKTTIFLMYLEVFAPLRLIQNLCCIGIGITTIFYTIITVLDAIWAFPLSRYYNATNTQKAQTLNLPKGIFGLTTVIFLFVVPVVAVSKLKLMTARKKVGILLIFSTGFLAVVSTAINIYWRVYINIHPDHFWYSTAIWIVTITEHVFGLIITDTHTSRGFRNYGSKIKYYLCCRVARKDIESKESVKRSERSTEGDQSQDRKSRKLYSGFDVTIVGGTALDKKANEEAEIEQFSTERQSTAQCPRNVLGGATERYKG
ncbi:hypothetical protein BOTNAR_0611g00040 [Botryotinia narcissicola]|uniref:Rhodopsin domain-containing protein n=1 Tax=Botryotinia narcissicola TaxID=278944 RepID=A0A4Z1HAG0_9HELO|nr:hypothetical protein BOTNAR_0611g00040 [Botryotinia narcissicola]